MEFDNLRNDFTISNLQEALPNLVKENYKFRQDIQVEYAGDIRPYLEPRVWSDQEEIKGLLINGRYQTINDEIYVEFEVYDIHNWTQLIKREIFCPVQDVICLHDAFLISIEQSISPFLAADLDIDDTVEALKVKPRKKRQKAGKDLDSGKDGDELGALNDLNEAEFYLDLDAGMGKQGQYGNRYYREFYLTDIKPDAYPSFEKNTTDLIAILDQILTNPYDVVIGDLSVEPDPFNPKILIGKLPIDYSVKNALVQDLLTNLPHEKLIDTEGNVMLQFSNNDFIFGAQLIDKLALMKYQIMPVIFFNNKSGGVQFIILDSWSDKYNRLIPRDVTILWHNYFSPLFALTPGADNIQFNMDVSTLSVFYEFSIPHDKIGNYTKVTVKFMQETELEKLLTGNLQEG